MTCQACASSKERPHSGAYRFQCLQCCTRLVLTTQPEKELAKAMLAAIERCPGNPGRAAVLESVRQALTKRPSAPKKPTTG